MIIRPIKLKKMSLTEANYKFLLEINFLLVVVIDKRDIKIVQIIGGLIV